jgi:hypothetical protein
MPKAETHIPRLAWPGGVIAVQPLKGISYNYALRSILPRVNTSNDFKYIS